MPTAAVSSRNPAWDDDDENADPLGYNARPYTCNQSGRASFIGQPQYAGRKGMSPITGIVDLHQIVQMINLSANKAKVLNLLTRPDLLKVIAMLPQNLLVNSLRLFSKQKLSNMMLHLPPKYVLPMMIQLFTANDLVKRMPTSQIMRIIKAPQMNNRTLAQGILTMNPQFIQLLLTRIYGGNRDYTKMKPRDIFTLLMETDRERINESLKTLPFKALQPMINKFIKKNPELIFNLSEYFVSKLVNELPKPMLLNACSILPPDMLMVMLEQLPNSMLVIAGSQIDDKTLEDYLVSQQGNLLQELASAA